MSKSLARNIRSAASAGTLAVSAVLWVSGACSAMPPAVGRTTAVVSPFLIPWTEPMRAQGASSSVGASGLATTSVAANTVPAALRAAFAHPQELLELVPMKLSPVEEQRTRYAVDVLFRPARITALESAPMTPDGAVATLHVALTDVNVFGLRLDRLTVDVRQARVDPFRLAAGQLRLLGRTPVEMTVRVLQGDLQRVAAGRTVSLRTGEFAVSGRERVLFVRAGYELRGRLEPTASNQLVLQSRGLSYGVLPVPRFVYENQIKALNPIFDLGRFLGATKCALDVKFASVDHQAGAVEVKVAGWFEGPSAAPPVGVQGPGGVPGAASTTGRQ